MKDKRVFAMNSGRLWNKAPKEEERQGERLPAS
jgi:hypothetical protein